MVTRSRFSKRNLNLTRNETQKRGSSPEVGDRSRGTDVEVETDRTPIPPKTTSTSTGLVGDPTDGPC